MTTLDAGRVRTDDGAGPGRVLSKLVPSPITGAGDATADTLPEDINARI
jgi:hypothetical protein